LFILKATVFRAITHAPAHACGWHRDRPYYADVIGISLVSPCIFRLRKKRGAETKGGWDRAALRFDPRSIYLMRGPSRDEWEHSIPGGGRASILVTFRSTRSVP
jgi:alkylated DNA repair dioxygenase AlkB